MKKVGITLAIIIGVFIALHLLLEPIAEHFANKQLANLEVYTGQVEDIDIQLYRGAYQVHGIEIVKREADNKEPFVEVDTVSISVDWQALFDGKIAAEIIVANPRVNVIYTPTVEGDSAQEQTGIEVDWVEQVQQIMPLTINRLEVKNGNISYVDPSVDPKVDAYFQELYLLAENISNVVDTTNRFPSSLKANAITVGEGEMNIDMKMNLLNSIPEFTMNMQLSNVQLTRLNDFIRAYAKFDVQQGVFELITEMTVENQQIDGYIKPFFENLDVFSVEEDLGDDDTTIFQKAWEALVGLGAEVFENQPKDRVATEVPIEGSLKSPNPDVSITIWNVFRNAFIDAIEKEFELISQNRAQE